MPEPIVAAVVVDGVERWGATDAPWVREAQIKAADQDKQTKAPATKAEEVAPDGDGADNAAPGDDPKPRPTKR